MSGSRQAYHVVSDLIRVGDWDALAPLVQPTCLESMVEHFDGSVRALPTDADDSMSIISAVLSSARVVEPCAAEGIAAGTCHLDVRFCSLQGVTLHDLQSVDPFHHAPPRLQESTWSFEGVAGATSDEDDASATAGAWRVIDIDWCAWTRLHLHTAAVARHACAACTRTLTPFRLLARPAQESVGSWLCQRAVLVRILTDDGAIRRVGSGKRVVR